MTSFVFGLWHRFLIQSFYLLLLLKRYIHLSYFNQKQKYTFSSVLYQVTLLHISIAYLPMQYKNFPESFTMSTQYTLAIKSQTIFLVILYGYNIMEYIGELSNYQISDVFFSNIIFVFWELSTLLQHIACRVGGYQPHSRKSACSHLKWFTICDHFFTTYNMILSLLALSSAFGHTKLFKVS